jgi:Rho GTPase-activating protein 1
MGYNGEKGGIPRVVKDCIQYLREIGTLIAPIRDFCI